jgi:AraC-like DNA-binding protein
MSDRVNLLRKSVNIPKACRERYVPLEHPALAGWKRAAVVYSGISDLVPGYSIVNLRPPAVMLIATTAGRGWAATPAGTVALEPGSCFIGVPGESVGWGIDGDHWRIVWWYLKPVGLWKPLATPRGVLRPYPRADLLAMLMDGLLDRLGGDGAVDRDLARLHGDSLLLHLRELAGAAPAAGDADPFASLWQEVGRSLHEPWSVPTIAARLGISASSLQREARRRFGRSIHQELVRLRMEHAREALRRTAYPLQAIAELVGFADPYTFSAAYRRWAGRPPSAERRLSRR